MFIHLGGDFVVSENEIVAICDLDTSTTSIITCDMLIKAEKEGTMIEISNELPKSFVVTTQENTNLIYLSPISTVALRGRMEHEWDGEQLGGLRDGGYRRNS